MDTRRSTNWLNQRLHQWEHSLAFFFEKLVHKRKFRVILIAVLVLGLILAFIFAQMPIAGETSPIPGYP
jgi:predicted PurR-regulated permease PerM